jgi:hypothetical protein
MVDEVDLSVGIHHDPGIARIGPVTDARDDRPSLGGGKPDRWGPKQAEHGKAYE